VGWLGTEWNRPEKKGYERAMHTGHKSTGYFSGALDGSKVAIRIVRWQERFRNRIKFMVATYYVTKLFLEFKKMYYLTLLNSKLYIVKLCALSMASRC